MMLFGLNALWDVSPKKWFRNSWWLVGACWVAVYALTWFWSSDKGTWQTTFMLKLPILLLPLAFRSLPRFTTLQLQALTLCMGIWLGGGAVYSLSFLLRDYAFYIREYNVSHMLPTPVYGEYITFSISCAIYVVWLVNVFGQLKHVAIKWISAIVALLLIAYIHILASKSGIIALYVFVIGYGVYLVLALRKYVLGLALLVFVPLFLVLAVQFVPTLNERWGHITFTYHRFRDGDTSGTLGDINRLYSYEIALKLIQQNPLLGTGTGDMLTEMKGGYATWHPEITEDRGKLIPHNQFLTVGLGCGIPAMLLFTIWVLMPLGSIGRNRASFFFFIIWLFLLFELMIEPFLEGQFKVFVFIFFSLLFQHQLPPRSKSDALTEPLSNGAN
jgi:O-antigen ligase